MAFIEKGDRTAFQRALRLGHGSAGVYLEEFGDAGVEEDLLHAVRENLCYDKQCESSREDYLFKLIQITERSDYYFREIIDLSNDPAADAYQVCGILALAAKSGFEEARPIVYQIFEYGLENEAWLAHHVVAMDGLPGLLRAADTVISKLVPDAVIPDYGFYSDILELMERTDWDSISIELEVAAKTRPLLQKSLAEVEERKELRESNGLRKSPYAPIETPEQFFEQLEREEKPSKWKHLLLPGNIRCSSEAIRTLAAETLIQSNNPACQKLLLRTYWTSKFPLDPTLLFPLIDSVVEDVRWRTCTALSMVPSSSIRDFVLANCKDKLEPLESLQLLAKSALAEDAHLVYDLATRDQNIDDFHRSLSRAAEIYQNTPGFDSPELLNFAYVNQPCTFCRMHIVELMIKHNYLTDAVRRECQWDAVAETRDLVSNL